MTPPDEVAAPDDLWEGEPVDEHGRVLDPDGLPATLSEEKSRAARQQSRAAARRAEREEAERIADERWASLATEEPGEAESFGAVKLADLLIPRLQGRFRWCKELGWLEFDGTKWRMDADPAVLTELVATIKWHTRRMLDDSPSGLTPKNLSELRLFSGASTQNQAIKIARGGDRILTNVSDFDPPPLPGAPWLLHCANGWTVEMLPDGRIKVRQTVPEDRNTHTACDYVPGDRADAVMAAFAQYQPDPDVRTFMLQMWARGLSGMGSETFTVNLGESGGNGKGTMQGVLESVARDYAVELPVEVILKGGNAAREVYRSELAQVRGARLVFCDEPEAGARYNLGMLKKITGGGTMQGRHMGREAVTFEPRILFQMASNNRPGWSADGGMQRRYIEILWDYQIDRTQQREAFKEELKAQSAGFLNVILDHWTGAKPLHIPDAVRKQSASGASQSSPAAQFVDEMVRADPGGAITGKAMYGAYVEWARQNGLRPITSTKFGLELGRLGYEKKRTASGMFYMDVTVDQ